MEEIINKISDLFEPIRTEINKYPKAISLTHTDGEGYIIEVDLAVLKPQLEAAGLIE